MASYVEKNFFEFPIRMYDAYSALNADLEEEKQLVQTGVLVPIPSAWATVIKVCRPRDIVGWVESGERGQDVKELSEGMPPLTIVSIREGLSIAIYECNWKRSKFEAKLNEKMSTYIA